MVTFQVEVTRPAARHGLEISGARREDDGAYSCAKIFVGRADEEAVGAAIGALAVFIAKDAAHGRCVTLVSGSVAYDIAKPIDFGRL